MVKILAAGDIHDNKEIMEKLAKKAINEKVDLIILAGDIHDYNTGDKEILSPLLETKKRILFVPGNCDTLDECSELKKKAKSIDGYYVTYNEVGIAGIGSAGWTLEHDLSDFLIIKKQMIKMKQKKRVLVSHLHAAGTLAEKMGNIVGWTGDSILREAVETFQPDILISAHIHEAEGVEDKIGKTRVIQVGRKGTILEI